MGESRGHSELLLSIGGVVGRLSLGPAPAVFLGQLRERYQAFTLPHSPVVEHAFTLTLAFRSAAKPAPDHWQKTAAHPLSVQAGSREMTMDRWDFEARLRSRGTSFAGEATCELNPFSFDSLLRVLWSIFLPRAGGALFHACGLRHGELGVLAPGPSGAGKTTLARKMADPDDVLSDEVVAVHPDPAQPGRWRVTGSPFWGEFARGGVSLRSLPLSAMAFLEQTAEERALPLSFGEAVQRALGCMLCFERDPATAERNLAVVTALCAQVPALACGTRAETPAARLFELLGPFLRRQPGEAAPSSREMISELRARLRRHAGYAFQARGGSMRPWLRAGDNLFVTPIAANRARPGDVVLYWRPGRTPDDDRLTCHRLVARVPFSDRTRIYTKGDALGTIERFENGRHAEIIGKVGAIHRQGRTVPAPGQSASLAILIASLATLPLLKLVGGT